MNLSCPHLQSLFCGLFNHSDHFLSLPRTPETHSAVFLGAFSPSAKKSPVVGFPRRQRASTSSNCPTTARRASCATSCAMPSAWTRASSSLNSPSPGQAYTRGWCWAVSIHTPRLRLRGAPFSGGTKLQESHEGFAYSPLFSPFLKPGWAQPQLTPSCWRGVFLQHNPIFSISLCHFHNAVFNGLTEIWLYSG